MVQKCLVYKKIIKCRRNLFSPKLKVLSDDITIILVSCLLVSRFCTTLGVKFHVFGTSKQG